jgi:hypothetical protein
MSILGFASKSPTLRFAAPVAAALLATTCVASAETLTYTGATITGSGPTIVTPLAAAGFGYAGLIHLTTASGTVNAWCVDLRDNFIQPGGTYIVGSSSVLTLAPGVQPLTPDQIGEISPWPSTALPLGGGRGSDPDCHVEYRIRREFHVHWDQFADRFVAQQPDAHIGS